MNQNPAKIFCSVVERKTELGTTVLAKELCAREGYTDTNFTETFSNLQIITTGKIF